MLGCSIVVLVSGLLLPVVSHLTGDEFVLPRLTSPSIHETSCGLGRSVFDDNAILFLELLEFTAHVLDVLVLWLELLLTGYELRNHVFLDLSLLLLCQTSFLWFLVGEQRCVIIAFSIQLRKPILVLLSAGCVLREFELAHLISDGLRVVSARGHAHGWLQVLEVTLNHIVVPLHGFLLFHGHLCVILSVEITHLRYFFQQGERVDVIVHVHIFDLLLAIMKSREHEACICNSLIHSC